MSDLKRLIESERDAEKDLRERLHISFEERSRRQEEMSRMQIEDLKLQIGQLISKTNQLESERSQQMIQLNGELKAQVQIEASEVLNHVA